MNSTYHKEYLLFKEKYIAGARFIVLHRFKKIIGNIFLLSLVKVKVGKLQSMGQLTDFVNNVLLGCSHAHLFLYCLCSCICSCATTAEWSTHVRYHMAHKPKIFATLPFKKKFADPWIKENKWKS